MLEAAFEASAIRFRPILMTAIATILGAVPLAFATGAGAETRNSMGIVIVGGLTLSTFLTLRGADRVRADGRPERAADWQIERARPAQGPRHRA